MLRILLIIGATLALPVSGFACSCAPTNGTACDFLTGTEVVFVGRVVGDSGEGWGTGPGRMAVEEVLRGLPSEMREVEVDTMAGTSCYVRLREDERYVIYGKRDKNRPDLVHREACSFSFLVRGNEMLLDALLQAEVGGPSRLVGTVYKQKGEYGGEAGGAGIRVVAERDGEHLETMTAEDGEFGFLAIAPGEWHLRVDSKGLVYQPKAGWPNGRLNVPAGGCEVRDLWAADDGHISGTVRDSVGKPAAGVPVQLFTVDASGEIGSSEFRGATTGKDGRYSISALPAQAYVVGVNADEYYDRLAYPPVYYPNTRRRSEAGQISLAEAEERDGIDLVVAAPRAPAILLIEAVWEDGRPAVGTGANVLGTDGVQRAFCDGKSAKDGVLRIPLWLGETYTVEAWHFDSHEVQAEGNESRTVMDESRGRAGPIQLTSPEMWMRVILQPVSQNP